MKLTKISETYLATDKGTVYGMNVKIKAVVENGKITLYTTHGNNEFMFVDSKPEMLVKIGGIIAKVGRKIGKKL